MMIRRLVLVAVGVTAILAAATSTSTTIVWKQPLAAPTANPINYIAAPIANGVFSDTAFHYVDATYNFNALNRTDGKLMWTLPNFSGLAEHVPGLDLLLITGDDPSTMTGIDAKTGTIRWYLTPHAYPTRALLTHGNTRATVQITDNLDDQNVLQVDLATGNVTWTWVGALTAPIECAPGLTFVMGNAPVFVAFGVNLTDGMQVWDNPFVWGTLIVGCLGDNKAAAWNSATNQVNLITVFDARTGASIMNITVDADFEDLFGEYRLVRNRFYCARHHVTYVKCYDLVTGAKTMDFNATSFGSLDHVFVLVDDEDAANSKKDVLALVLRDYATSGNVTLLALDPSTGAKVWTQSTVTPYKVLSYYQPGGFASGPCAVINNDDGFTVMSRKTAFNVKGLGPWVRMSALLPKGGKLDFSRGATFVTNDTAYSIDL